MRHVLSEVHNLEALRTQNDDLGLQEDEIERLRR